MSRKGQKVKIGLVQMRAAAEPEANLAKAVERIGEAARRGARIVSLQELFRSRYFCQTEDTRAFNLAEPVPGPTTEALSKLAKKLAIVVVAPIFEKRAQGVYHNTSVVIDADGRMLGKYRKMHVPDDPNYYEKFYFTPGDLGFKSFSTRYGKIGVLICWDQWFPEAARLTALSGAQILFYPTAIGWHIKEKAEVCRAQHDAWETVQRAHAVENGVYVAVTNRVGVEEGLKFWGQSFVADPFGRVVHLASAQKEEVVVVECDLRKIDETRHNWPFLRDRRIDAYEGLMKRFLDYHK